MEVKLGMFICSGTCLTTKFIYLRKGWVYQKQKKATPPKLNVDLPSLSFILNLVRLNRRGPTISLYLCGEMRAELPMFIGLRGSHTQVGGDTERLDVWTEVRALRDLLMETMVRQKILQTQVNELKAKKTPSKQPKNANMLFLWVLIRVLRVLLVFFLSFCSQFYIKMHFVLLLYQRKQRWPFTQL